jgi:addiction module HigA family antidote
MATHDYTTFEEPLAHPGQHLREDFLPDYNLTAGALAKAMGLNDLGLVELLIRETQPVTPNTALRLGRVFGTSAEFWMNLQIQHDLSVAAIAAREELAAIEALPRPGPPLVDFLQSLDLEGLDLFRDRDGNYPVDVPRDSG